MKYFDFDTLNEKTETFLQAGSDHSHAKYFDFITLNEKVEFITSTILLCIIITLVYIWVKLFLYYDSR